MRAIACECFVDRVVNGFINEVVQTFLTNVADVHGRALAHSFQAFKHLDITGGIIATVLFDFFHILISKSGLRPLSCFLFFATYKCGTLLSAAHSADFNEVFHPSGRCFAAFHAPNRPFERRFGRFCDVFRHRQRPHFQVLAILCKDTIFFSDKGTCKAVFICMPRAFYSIFSFSPMLRLQTQHKMRRERV